ncbi:MAG: hypothetical protein B7733_09680 [Myxococcales bacterium FL481]|nr:MAG: hypothetical protein B7733_09680 [Myxococcales bacterium FL481]
MPAVQFSGLASGLNTTEIIGAIMGAERIPVMRIENENRELRSQVKILDELTGALSNLSGKSEALGTLGDFLSYKGSITDSEKATVTAGGEAVPGTYSLNITQLAAAQRTYSTTFSDETASLTSSDTTLTISMNGEDTEVEVEAGTSLNDLVGLINGSGANVTAGLMYDGSDYRLQVVGNETGADNAITFDDGDMTLDLSNTVQAAVDAQFDLDGIDITSATNTVTDALAGVALELKEVTTSEETIRIEPDPELVKTKVTEFVDAYNEVINIIRSQQGEGKGGDTLNGDSSLRTVEQQLQSLVTSPVNDLTDSNGDQLALGRLGIETQRDGTLLVSDTDLSSFLAEDFRLAATIFVGEPENEVDGLAAQLDDLIDGYTQSSDGLLSIRKDGINSRIDSNQDRIATQEAYLERFEANLRNQYTQLESTMSALQSQQQYLARFLLG